MKYLLPCSCGKSITVEVSDAGRVVTCECGISTEVPGLRGIRELDVVETQEAGGAAKPNSNWTVAHGIIFVVGVVVFLNALAVASYYYYWTTQLITTKPPSGIDMAEVKKGLDETTYAGALDAWDGLVEYGLGTYHPPGYVIARQKKREWMNYAMIAGGVALVGLIMVGGALVSGGGKRNQ